MAECLFCRIVTGESPADIVYEDDAVVAFRDIYPKAPVHLLIVPRRHIPSVSDLEPADAELVGHCFVAARRLGEATGFATRGYRVSVNCGPEGGQVVYHLHFHFTAGRQRGACRRRAASRGQSPEAVAGPAAAPLLLQLGESGRGLVLGRLHVTGLARRLGFLHQTADLADVRTGGLRTSDAERA